MSPQLHCLKLTWATGTLFLKRELEGQQDGLVGKGLLQSPTVLSLFPGVEMDSHKLSPNFLTQNMTYTRCHTYPCNKIDQDRETFVLEQLWLDVVVHASLSTDGKAGGPLDLRPAQCI